MRRNVNRWLGGAAVLAALLGLGGTGNTIGAQTATSNLRGYVTATGGAALGDAQVAARQIATNQTRGTTTNAAGFFYMGGLRPGTYEVTVRRIGFSPQTRTVALPIGETVDLNVSTGEVTQQLAAVAVTGVRTGTTTRTSEVGTNISREQIDNLPNYERNVLDLAKLTPGVMSQDVNNGDKFIRANGQPAEAVNIFVDGASYKNDVLRGGVVGQDASKGNPLPQGAIQEFRVLTQNYKAEYQRASSLVIVATTKTGTNNTEADAFAYGVGKAYVARDYFTMKRNGARPNYDRLQAGGNIGGPIIKDKLFYFGTYELNFRDEPAYILLGSDSLRAPTALRQQLLAQTGLQQQQFREHLGLGKITWVQSDKNTLDASVTLRHDNDFRGFGGQTAYEASENMRVNTTTGVVNFKHAGDRWLNETQLGAQYFQWNPTATNFGTIGKDYIGLLRTGGKDTDQDFKQTRITLRNDVTRGGVQLGGDHVFKFGASVDLLGYKGTKFFNGNPVFTYAYDSAPGATPAQVNRWQTPIRVSSGFGNPSINTSNQQFGLYAQDDWSVGRKLVFNLGIRWDAETNGINNSYVTPRALADTLRAQYAANQLFATQNTPGNCCVPVNVISQLGGIENYITTGRGTRPIYWKEFQPRLGASYDLSGDGRTVLFGGAGLYYDRNYWNTLFDEQFRRQYSVITVNFSNNCAGAPNCAAFDPKYYDPAQLRQLSVSAGKPEVFLVKNDMTPPHSYQMSFGVRHQFSRDLVTLSYNGLEGRNYMNFIRGGPWGGGTTPYSTVFVADDRVKTRYNAIELQLERPLVGSSRFGGQLAYTLSKAEEQGQSTDLFWGFNDQYPTVANMPWRRQPGDQRHLIVMNGLGRAPFGLLASAIVTLGTGITVNANDQTLGTGVGQVRSYIFTPPSRAFLGLGHVFAFQNLDFRLQKDLDFVTGQRASILFDLFNAFNSANFGCYNTDIRPGNTGYGRPGCSGLGRRLQVGIRYGFRPSTAMRE
ncbi:MAG: carboxypeptidase regulatory-like domain-containing protein [Gemmatimonadaceae bacterium]